MSVAIVTVLLVLIVVLAPFLIGPGGRLAHASSQMSQETLVAAKKAIVRRYLSDERAFEKKDIGKTSWNKRKVFLLRRYIDIARRLDYLEKTRDEQV